jgi:hypothetical protein
MGGIEVVECLVVVSWIANAIGMLALYLIAGFETEPQLVRALYLPVFAKFVADCVAQ